MEVFLTKYDGMILGPIANILGYILEAIYSFFSMMGIDNVGLCIIFFTFVINGLIFPLTMKQQKFSKLNTLVTPEIQAIQAKYKNKKDQESMTKMRMEQQEVYSKYGVSPTAGCLPMLITLPIFFALYRVIYNVPAYVPQIKEIYEGMINSIMNAGISVSDFADSIASFVKDGGGHIALNADLSLVNAPSISSDSNLIDTIVKGFSNHSFDSATSSYLVDIFSQFKADHWDAFKQLAIFKNHSDVVGNINSSYDDLKGIYSFLGMNIMESPSFTDLTISIPILAVVTQFISNRIMMSNNKKNNSGRGNENDTATNSMNMMNNIMPFMSGFFCFMFPIGVGLYWVAGSLFRIIQGIFINMYFNKVGIDALAAKNIEKKRKKLEKKGITTDSTKMKELATTRTSSIKSNSRINTSSSSAKNKSSRQDLYINKDIKNGSIADYANMLNRDYFEGNDDSADVNENFDADKDNDAVDNDKEV